MSKILTLVISAVLVLICVSFFYHVITNKNLSNSRKILWIIAFCIFNVIAVVIYFIIDLKPHKWFDEPIN